MILHIDMDSFFASVEERDNPDLKNLPVVVGGDSKRAVVSTANYIAREYGVRAGMPIFMAKEKLPKTAIYLPVNMEKYVSVSTQIKKLLYDFSPFVEMVSIDEAFIDVSGIVDIKPFEVGNNIKNKILKELNLPCSIGIGKNRSIAKIASKKAKPNLPLGEKREYEKIGIKIKNNIFEVPLDKTLDFLNLLKIKDLFGVGPKTTEILSGLGIINVPDLKRFDISILKSKIGNKSAEYIKRLSAGGDISLSINVDKSISKEITLENFVSTEKDIKKIVKKLSDDIGFILREKNMLFKTVSIIVKTSDFVRKTKSITLLTRTNITKDIFNNSYNLALSFANKKPIRLLGIKLSGLAKNTAGFQGSVDNIHEHQWDLATDKIRKL